MPLARFFIYLGLEQDVEPTSIVDRTPMWHDVLLPYDFHLPHTQRSGPVDHCMATVVSIPYLLLRSPPFGSFTDGSAKFRPYYLEFLFSTFTHTIPANALR